MSVRQGLCTVASSDNRKSGEFTWGDWEGELRERLHAGVSH